jgi:SAM-dependent methyltransferase
MRIVILFLLLCSNIFGLKNPYYFLKRSYPYDPRIHNFGNTGVGGRIHAELVPTFTRLIDHCVYDSFDIRKSVLINEHKDKAIIDLCCGVGISTSNNDESIGIDTSPEMLAKAKLLYPEKKFELEHAEYYNPERTWDIATCFFAFHEMPPFAWENIIKNAEKFTKEKIIIVDISPEYIPSKCMLSGEPYIEDYKTNIKKSLVNLGFDENILIKNHVHRWDKFLK